MGQTAQAGKQEIIMGLTAKPGKQEILMISEYDAPREQVFKALTDSALIAQWWGPRYLRTYIERLETRPGGTWRYIQRDEQGGEYVFHGVFHAVQPPQRLVYTFEFEGMPGHVLLETILLEALGERTRMYDQVVFQSVEDRDGMLQNGMEEGTAESASRLADLLTRMGSATPQ